MVNLIRMNCLDFKNLLFGRERADFCFNIVEVVVYLKIEISVVDCF